MWTGGHLCARSSSTLSFSVNPLRHQKWKNKQAHSEIRKNTEKNLLTYNLIKIFIYSGSNSLQMYTAAAFFDSRAVHAVISHL